MIHICSYSSANAMQKKHKMFKKLQKLLKIINGHPSSFKHRKPSPKKYTK